MAYKQLKLWFDKELAYSLGQKIQAVHSTFPISLFIREIEIGIPGLELKDRIEVFADGFENHLQGEFTSKLNILLQILGPENPDSTGMFKQFYWIMPVAKFVEKYGLNHLNASLRAIEEITKRNTGEYAIRPFLRSNRKATVSQMERWSLHENFHVRRLASEGMRPRLPWAAKLDQFILDPLPVLAVLENLKDDSSLYVRKSVANCMNDILKDNPDIAMEVLHGWSTNAGPERAWVIRHALRNKLRQNNREAMELVSLLGASIKLR